MSTVGNWRGPNIVKDGLVLYLDAGSPNSYWDKTSTTWRDISGNANNGTLINSPIFNSTNGGNLQFNGSNQRVDTPITLSQRNFTLDAIFQINTLSGWRTLIGQDSDNPGVYGSFYFQKADATTTSNGTTRLFDRFGFSISNNLNSEYYIYDPGAVMPINTWLNYTVTVSPEQINLYKNGILLNTLVNNFTYATVLSTSKVYLGAGVFNNNVGDYWPGRIGVIKIYNRPLSSDEVLQNFNAIDSARFSV